MALCCLCCFAGWDSSVSGLTVHSHVAAHSMQAAVAWHSAICRRDRVLSTA